jgi:hypothetical protein
VVKCVIKKLVCVYFAGQIWKKAFAPKPKVLNDLFYVITWNCIAICSVALYLRNE